MNKIIVITDNNFMYEYSLSVTKMSFQLFHYNFITSISYGKQPDGALGKDIKFCELLLIHISF